MDYRIITAFILSFAISVILYKLFIPVLRKVKLGQKILEIGPAWHKCKEGTPVLGGLFFIISILIVLLIYILPSELENNEYGIIAVVVMALAFGLIGFIDDYVKLFKKRNKGLSATQKLILQFLVAAAYLWSTSEFCGASSEVWLPISDKSIELGAVYYFIAIIVIVYIVNCANLTDGIDGLAGTVAVVIGVMFFTIALSELDKNAALLSASLIGAVAGYLIFNFHPAKIFMGDTGSLFLGGLLVGLTFYFRAEILILIICFIWFIEGISVILQVASYKLTHKRIFKMSPIHHHFEMSGWSEFKIVTVFSLISAVMCGFAYYLYVL